MFLDTMSVIQLLEKLGAKSVIGERVYSLKNYYLLITSKRLFLFDSLEPIGDSYKFSPNQSLTSVLLNDHYDYDSRSLSLRKPYELRVNGDDYWYAFFIDEQELNLDVSKELLNKKMKIIDENKSSSKYENVQEIVGLTYILDENKKNSLKESAFGYTIEPLFKVLNVNKYYYSELINKLKEIDSSLSKNIMKLRIYNMKVPFGKNNIDITVHNFYFEDILISSSLHSKTYLVNVNPNQQTILNPIHTDKKIVNEIIYFNENDAIMVNDDILNSLYLTQLQNLKKLEVDSNKRDKKVNGSNSFSLTDSGF